MYEKIEAMKAFTKLGLDLLNRRTADLEEAQLDWKYCAEANTIRWILTHLSYEMHVFFPKIVKGKKDYKPEGWPDDHVGNPGYSLEKIKEDLETGKAKLMKILDSLTPEALAEEMDWWLGVKPKEAYLMIGISEIFRHEGQVAAILGVEKRMQGA
jgi:hypothetical protein